MPSDKQGTVALNNYLQGKGELTCLSWVDTTQGPKDAPEWTSVCKIYGEIKGRGTGLQKHVARDKAADQALKALKESDDVE